MELIIDKNTFVVFDLDDTLYKEIDYLISAYNYIASEIIKSDSNDLVEKMLNHYYSGNNVFEWLIENFKFVVPNLNKDLLLNVYRTHIPQIALAQQTASFLKNLKDNQIKCGLITDGRSITQRNKLMSLGLKDYFDDVIISEEFGSEKPDLRNFIFFENKYAGMNFIYIADNVNKDFIAPHKLGWQMICIEADDKNIYKQDVNVLPPDCILTSNFGELQYKVISGR